MKLEQFKNNKPEFKLEEYFKGKTVVAMASDKSETIFVSTDYGVTWRRTDESFFFVDIALSRNGDTVIGSTSSTWLAPLRLHSAKIN